MTMPKPAALFVYARNGRERGVKIGSRPCNLEGCCGTRFCVRWKNGKRTWPCSRGMKMRRDGHLQII
jgi:hypothetical protein